MKQPTSKNKIWFEKEMFISDAFLAIRKPASFKVLFRFYHKRRFQNKNANHPRKKYDPVLDKDGRELITNNGEIEFTYSEAQKRLNIKSSATFRDAIDELVDLGFIDIAVSGFGVDKVKTLYAISCRWEKYGTPEFIKRKRPERPFKVGFQKGNKLGRNCRTK